MRKTKGFTLIELIVTMAIIGVLAAILVPSMIGYLNDAKLSRANVNAKQAYNTAASYATVCEKKGTPPVADISCEWIPCIQADEVIPYDGQHLLEFMGKVFGPANNHAGYVSVKLDNNVPDEAAWVDDLNSELVGLYPDMTRTPGGSMILS